MVRIRMRLALKHFRDHNAGESTRNLLLLLDTVNLYSYRRHGIRYLLRGKVGFKIILKPIVRKLHICNVLFLNVFSGEQRIDELLLVKHLEVVDALSDPDELDRNLQLVNNADDHSALCRTVQLGDRQ